MESYTDSHWPFTLHCMKGLSRTKIGMRVRTIKSMKSQKARPPTFLRAISFTCRLSRYHWFPNERSKQTNTTFRAGEERQRYRKEAGTRVAVQTCHSSFIPRYAAWLVDSAKPSLRRSFPVSPGVEQ